MNLKLNLKILTDLERFMYFWILPLVLVFLALLFYWVRGRKHSHPEESRLERAQKH